MNWEAPSPPTMCQILGRISIHQTGMDVALILLQSWVKKPSKIKYQLNLHSNVDFVLSAKSSNYCDCGKKLNPDLDFSSINTKQTYRDSGKWNVYCNKQIFVLPKAGIQEVSRCSTCCNTLKHLWVYIQAARMCKTALLRMWLRGFSQYVWYQIKDDCQYFIQMLNFFKVSFHLSD